MKIRKWSISYQSNYFDFYLQFYPEWRTILFNNSLNGPLLMKTTLLSDDDTTIYRGYGLYFDIHILGIRFGIYLAPIRFKAKCNGRQQ